KLALEKPVAPVSDADLDKSLDRIRAANIRYKPKEGAAENADRLIVDFTGTIDGTPFEGGATEDAPIVLGSGNFIPGFEEGLVGARAGQEREIDATFPEVYPQAKLAGKAARFAVKIKEVGAPETPALDDDFAKSLGIESVEKMRETIKQRLEQDRAGA